MNTPKLKLPKLLDIPPKLYLMITTFNDYRYLLLEGGRGSAKTHSIARFLLYLGDLYKLRIVCGREFQNSIEESVYTVLKDIIEEYNLNYEVTAKKIIHRTTGTTFTFKGFRDQNRVNIKGLEGVDILWIDEAQSVTKTTLEIIIPTIRKDNAKLIFTMNRFMDDDAVPDFLEGRQDCLHIQINYFENPYCPMSIKIEAEELKRKSEREYEHIYLGVPLQSADDILFNYKTLSDAFKIVPFGETAYPQRVIGIDFAAQGNDQCVASILDRKTNQHWELSEQIAWDEADAMISVGRIVDIIGQYKPTASILDVGGMGHVVWNRLQEIGVNIQRFDGATVEGVDTKHYVNARANGYYQLKDWFENGFLKINETDSDLIRELKKIRMKFRSDGRRLLQAKVDMKKDMGYSPDRADSLMMAVWCACKYLGDANTELRNQNANVKRVTNRRARRR